MSDTVEVRAFYQELEYQHQEKGTATLGELKHTLKAKFNTELNNCLGLVPELTVEVYPNLVSEDTPLSEITNCTPIVLVTPCADASPIYTQAKEAKKKAKNKKKNKSKPNQQPEETKEKPTSQNEIKDHIDELMQKQAKILADKEEKFERELRQLHEQLNARDQELKESYSQVKEMMSTIRLLLPDVEKMRKLRLRILIDKARQKIVKLLAENGINDVNEKILVEYLESNVAWREVVQKTLEVYAIPYEAVLGSKFREPGHVSAHISSREELIAAVEASRTAEEQNLLNKILDFVYPQDPT